MIADCTRSHVVGRRSRRCHFLTCRSDHFAEQAKEQDRMLNFKLEAKAFYLSHDQRTAEWHLLMRQVWTFPGEPLLLPEAELASIPLWLCQMFAFPFGADCSMVSSSSVCISADIDAFHHLKHIQVTAEDNISPGLSGFNMCTISHRGLRNFKKHLKLKFPLLLS